MEKLEKKESTRSYALSFTLPINLPPNLMRFSSEPFAAMQQPALPHDPRAAPCEAACP